MRVLVFAVAVIALVLLKGHYVLGHREDLLTKALLAMPFLLVIGFESILVLRRGRVRKLPPNRLVLAYSAFILVTLVTVAISYLAGLIATGTATKYLGLILTTSLFALVLGGRMGVDQPRSLAKLIIAMISVFVLLNWILIGMGIENRSIPERFNYVGAPILLSLLGFSADKVMFPMSNSFINHGTLAGLLLVLTGAELRPRGLRRTASLIYGVLFLIALLTMLVVDARGALLCSFLALVAVPFLTRMPARVGALLSVTFGLAFPFFLIAIDQMLRGTVTADMLSRSAGGIFSSRATIWGRAIEAYLDGPPLNVFFGYGYQNVPEGFLSQVYVLFQYLSSDLDQLTVHNSILQHAFDSGVTGFIVFLMLFYMLFVTTLRLTGIDRRVLFSAVAYVWLIGSVSASISVRFTEMFFLLGVLVAGLANAFRSMDSRGGWINLRGAGQRTQETNRPTANPSAREWRRFRRAPESPRTPRARTSRLRPTPVYGPSAASKNAIPTLGSHQ